MPNTASTAADAQQDPDRCATHVLPQASVHLLHVLMVMQQSSGIVTVACLTMLPTLRRAQQSCSTHSNCMQRTSRCQSDAAADGVDWSICTMLPVHDKESMPAGNSWSGSPAGAYTSLWCSRGIYSSSDCMHWAQVACSDDTNVFHACTINPAMMAFRLHSVDPSGNANFRLGSALVLFSPTAACRHQQT